ncbi:pitrilysin family protein, partial [Anaerolinea sp.]|uniref:M16 family metallopeptidase n=1 Tax=Anaerolinea sp. TaxID=1872519 RepID=UPI002ACEAFAC
MSLVRPEILQTLPGPEDITRVELPNGIVVLVRSNFESASVTLSGYLPAGGLFDPPEKLGLAHFTALGLMRGTERHHFQQIFNLLESAGASLGFGASVYNINFGGRALAEDLPLLLNLLAECLRIPRFPQKPIERLRRQILTGIAIRDQDPADRAEMMFDEVLFPNHPFGKPTDGTRHTIARITREDLLAFHHHYFGPRGMTLV